MKGKKGIKTIQRVGPGSKQSGAIVPVAHSAATHKGDARAGMHKRDACATSGAPRKQRVLVVDDHPCVQMALRMIINGEPDWEVCGVEVDAKPALAAVEKLKPDLVIVDLMLPGSHGLDLIRDLKIQYPHIPAIVHSAHAEETHALLCIHAGARGYLNKGADVNTVREALRTVLNGGTYASEQVRQRVADCVLAAGKTPTLHPLADLSPRELQVFEMIGRGLALKEIARQLGVDHETAERHRLHIGDKLGLSSPAEVLSAAILWMQFLPHEISASRVAVPDLPLR